MKLFTLLEHKTKPAKRRFLYILIQNHRLYRINFFFIIDFFFIEVIANALLKHKPM